MKKIFSLTLLTCFAVSLTACQQSTRHTEKLANDCENYYVNVIMHSGELMEEDFTISISDNTVLLSSHDATGKSGNTYTVKDDLASDILVCAEKHEDSLHEYNYSISVDDNTISGLHY